MNSKSPLPLIVPTSRPKSHSRLRLLLFPLSLLALSLHYNFFRYPSDEIDFDALASKGAICPKQPEPLFPAIDLALEEGYRDVSAGLLSAAVQIPTQSYDNNGLPTEDPRWAPFFDFQKWLVDAFPLLHEVASVEYVNTLGIVLTLQGSNSTLKPLILMSHYDVVPAPADTLSRWTHPPFSGLNDGTYIWGRGAADCKTLLVAQYEALTILLHSGWRPRRTVVLNHGFDEEEVGKRQGAGEIVKVMEERYGKDGILLVVDEGGGTNDDMWGGAFAMPANGEKGYCDVKVTVNTPGGHSSVPPPHTAIGIMSLLIAAIESKPYTPTLTTSSPLLGFAACAAQYAPDYPKKWKKLLKDPKKWTELAEVWAEEAGVGVKSVLSTTQAIDIVNGGVKVNALPERVEMMMNFRIDFASSVAETQARLSHTISKIASTYNFSYAAFPDPSIPLNTTALGPRYITSELFAIPIEPSPRTVDDGAVWEVFAGTIRAVIPGPEGKERIVTPFAPGGNTDTKVYWNLSKNIYRFMSADSKSGSGYHTVDERASIDGHLRIIKWIHGIVQNVDAYDGAE